jgi:hypothetical protein
MKLHCGPSRRIGGRLCPEKIIYFNQRLTARPEDDIKRNTRSAGAMAPNLAMRQNTRLAQHANFPEGT